MKKSKIIVPAVLGTLGVGVAVFVMYNEHKKPKDNDDLEQVNKMVDDVQSKLDQISELAKEL